MQRVKGIGGVFFKAQDKARTLAWYRDCLGLEPEDFGGQVFRWRDSANPEKTGSTIWGVFPHDTTYFGADGADHMVNFRVDDLDAMLAQLRSAGAAVDDHIEEMEFGRFAWVLDPDGHRVELWEPAPGF